MQAMSFTKDAVRRHCSQEGRTEKVFLLRQLHNEGATARKVVSEMYFYRDGCTAEVYSQKGHSGKVYLPR